jgi:electron-transferring-flavoprotein dehydrogenase
MSNPFGRDSAVGLGGLDTWTNEFLKSSIFGTLKHDKPDSDTLRPISVAAPAAYPKPDSALTFDKLSSVYLSNTNHEEDQHIHLRLHDPDIPIRDNLPRFGEPSRLYCPAGIYEVVYANEANHSDPRFYHQRAETRPFQSLRYQGPGQEY